jgi:hypothetical protein
MYRQNGTVIDQPEVLKNNIDFDIAGMSLTLPTAKN